MILELGIFSSRRGPRGHLKLQFTGDLLAVPYHETCKHCLAGLDMYVYERHSRAA